MSWQKNFSVNKFSIHIPVNPEFSAKIMHACAIVRGQAKKLPYFSEKSSKFLGRAKSEWQEKSHAIKAYGLFHAYVSGLF